jgi:cobalt/nickel transport system ATP-binding protein
MNVVSAKNLTVKYDKRDAACALNGVSFSVTSGERVALVGANGAGKSTLLLTLAGVLPVSGGELKSAEREKTGVIFQNPDDQLFMPTVYDDVAFAPRNARVSEDKIAEIADKTLESLHIQHLKLRMTHQLSGGEKRLTALAGVLVSTPELLLMDEPSSFLDPRARRNLIEILNKLPQTMIIATHDLDFALDTCNRVIILNKGLLVGDGTIDILYDVPRLESCGLEPPLSYSRKF